MAISLTAIIIFIIMFIMCAFTMWCVLAIVSRADKLQECLTKEIKNGNNKTKKTFKN